MTNSTANRSVRAFRLVSPLSAGAFLLLAGCKLGSGLHGDGEVKTESRPVAGFTAIELAGVGDLNVTQTGTESLTIEAEGNLLPLLTSTVSGGRLVLGSSKEISPTKTVHYTVTVKDLTALQVSGAGNVTATNLHTGTLSIHLDGAGRIVAAGQAQNQEVVIAGAGAYDGEKLESKTATVTQSGVGSAVVRVSDTLSTTISGLGSIEYIGDPKVTQSSSGLGSVKKRP